MTGDSTRSGFAVTRRSALSGLGAGALGLALTARHFGTSAQDASPMATAIPMAGHPLIGSWQMENLDVWSFGDNGKFGLFETSGYRFCVGEWRPTGAQSAELVFVLQGLMEKDLFDPAQAGEPFELGPRFELWQLTVTVDETGDTMTVDGQWESYIDGTPEPGDPQHQTGIRMAPVTTQAGATLSS